MSEYTNIILDNIVSVVSAIIACWALFRTSKIEHTQSGQRAHWFFDDYLLSVGKCIGSYEKNKEEYFGNYMRYMLYAEKEIEQQMKTINTIISSGDTMKIVSEVEKIKRLYNKKYKIRQYQLKNNYKN